MSFIPGLDVGAAPSTIRACPPHAALVAAGPGQCRDPEWRGSRRAAASSSASPLSPEPLARLYLCLTFGIFFEVRGRQPPLLKFFHGHKCRRSLELRHTLCSLGFFFLNRLVLTFVLLKSRHIYVVHTHSHIFLDQIFLVSVFHVHCFSARVPLPTIA